MLRFIAGLIAIVWILLSLEFFWGNLHDVKIIYGGVCLIVAYVMRQWANEM